MGVRGGGECVRGRMSGSEWRMRQCVRGCVSGIEWRDTLALMPVSSSIHSRSPSLSHTLPLHSLSHALSPPQFTQWRGDSVQEGG